MKTPIARQLGSIWLAWSIGLIAQAQETARTAEPATTKTEKPEDRPPTAFALSSPVACIRVDGLEQFTPLPGATLTNSDKLKVYFRPLRYKVEVDPKNKSPYRAKFVEDGRIRRKGDKNPIAKEDKLLEYETRYDQADREIYLVNTIGIESLTPGEYELDITLHDSIDGTATAKQTLAFKVVPGPDLTPAPEPESATKKPARTSKARTGRTAKKPG